MATTYQTQGTSIGRGNAASPEVFTTIAQVTDIDGIGTDRNTVETTNLQSTAREYQLTIEDGGEITLTIQYDPDDTTHAGLKTDLDNNTLRNFQVALTDSPAQTWTFAARVRSFKLGKMSPDGVQMVTVILRTSGGYTVA